MNRMLSHRFVLALALVAAWVPAAMYAVPGARAAADVPALEAPPAAGETGQPQAAAVALRDA